MKLIYLSLAALIFCSYSEAQRVTPRVLSSFFTYDREDRPDCTGEEGGYCDRMRPPAGQELRCLISCNGHHIVIVPGSTIWGRRTTYYRSERGGEVTGGTTAGTEGGLLGTRRTPGSFCSSDAAHWYIGLLSADMTFTSRHQHGVDSPWRAAGQSRHFGGQLSLLISLNFPVPPGREGGFDLSVDTSRDYTHNFANLDEPFIRRVRGAQVECRLQPLEGRGHWSTLDPSRRSGGTEAESSGTAPGSDGSSAHGE